MISEHLRFETKVLDIAYLLMLKLMKEPNFKFDKKSVLLHIKILAKQGKYKDALAFIEVQSSFFTEKMEKQHIEADLNILAGSDLVAINQLFSMLRVNGHVEYYQDMWTVYQQCIRVVFFKYLAREKKMELPNDWEAKFAKFHRSKDGKS